VSASLGQMPLDLLAALAGGGLMVAAIGFLDDRRPMRAGIRFAVHAAAAIWALVCLGGLPAVQLGDRLVELGWSGYVLAALGIIWTLNLFNFMDGIDGIAASEAVFVGLGAVVVGVLGNMGSEVLLPAALFAAASAGFLVWNWPPARIFMGDVGSGYLGYAISVMALYAGRQHAAAVWIWLVLGGVFFTDATVTLLRRLFAGQKVYLPHRSHAYQWLSRRWRSHLRVTAMTLAVNIGWMLPCAIFATLRPQLAFACLGVALVPVVIAVVIAGAGRPEGELS
jgi:Fuc2NAc and GlcNAc transferase